MPRRVDGVTIDDSERSAPVLWGVPAGVSELRVAYASECRFRGVDGRSHPGRIDTARFDDVSGVLREFGGMIHASTVARPHCILDTTSVV